MILNQKETNFNGEIKMRIRILLVMLTAVSLAFLSCSSSNTNEPYPYGSYIYRSYNFLGDLVGEGTLYINQPDSNGVTGNWSIQKVRECNNCGAQFGSGILIGSLEEDTLRVNLNPDEVYIDTELIGEFVGGNYNGEWKWVNQAGFGFSGSFTASKD